MSGRDSLPVWGFCGLAVLAVLAGCNKPSAGSPGLEPPRGLGPHGLDAGFGSQPQGSNPGDRATGGAAAMGSAGAAATGPAGGFGNSSPGSAGSSASSTDAGIIPGGGAFWPPASNSTPGEELDAGTGSLDPMASDPLFAGFWVVDQPGHALYEATLYELVTGGALIEHETYLLSPPPYDGYVTGTVVQEQAGIRCTFSSSWTGAGERRLRISSACTDGTPRAVLLAFPAGDEAQGLTPTIESVQGESGWAHPDFAWTWRKCSSRANCPPF
jgi:hypothetical protein